MQTPEGIRNNNPGNIRYSPHTSWVGLDTPPEDADGFCRFKEAQWGLRALIVDIHNALNADHRGTLREVITHYAPPTENDTAAYIKAVSFDMGIDPDAALDLASLDTYVGLAEAICHHENGPSPAGLGWFPEAQYQAAYKLAGFV